MGEREVPERNLEYSKVKALFDTVGALINDCLNSPEGFTIVWTDTSIEIIKALPRTPEGQSGWVSLYKESNGTTQALRVARIVQAELPEEGVEDGLEAAVSGYSFLAFNVSDGAGAPTARQIVHSARWQEEKRSGAKTQIMQEGGILDARLSLAMVQETEAQSPIRAVDKPEIDYIIATFRDNLTTPIGTRARYTK